MQKKYPRTNAAHRAGPEALPTNQTPIPDRMAKVRKSTRPMSDIIWRKPMRFLAPILLLLAWPALAEDIGDKTTGWSTTAANNNAAAPDGWPENMAPSAVNNAARENMRAVRKWFNDAQWIEYGDGDGAYTVTWVSSTQFKIEGVDVSSVYHVGRRVKLVNTTEGTVYGTITAVSFSTDTTVTVGSFNLTNEAITSVELGILTQTNSSFPRVADLSDADGDTLVQLEEGADDDTFRVDAGGTGDMLTVAANAITFGGGTQDYIWSKRSNTALAVQGQTSGQAVLLDLFSADGDGTDDIRISLYNQGTPSDTNNPERLTIEYDADLGFAEIFTFAGGTGTLHPLRLFTGLNNDQLILTTSAEVIISHTSREGVANSAVGGGGAEIFPVLQVLGDDNSDSHMTIQRWAANTGGPQLTFAKSRGASIGTHTSSIVADDDTVGALGWAADDGTDLATQIAMVLGRIDDASPTTSSIGGELEFWVGEGAGADDSRKVWSIRADGSLQSWSFATLNMSIEDAGSVGATEQDWIEVTVGGVTGYIRVFATK